MAKGTSQCRACRHEKRTEIDCAVAGGEILTLVAQRFGISRSGLKRHRKHIPASLVVAPQAKDVARASTVLEHVQGLLDEAKRFKILAEEKGDIRTAMLALREVVRIVELLAKLTGELEVGDTNVLHVHVTPEKATEIAQMYLSRRKPAALPEAIDV
jgi:hypothetical protein